MKYILIIIALFQLSACKKSTPVLVPQAVDDAPTPTPTPHVELDVGALIKLSCDETCTDLERNALPEIELKINNTLASQCFKDYFISPQRQFKNTLGLTGTQIVEKLQRGANLKLSYYYNRWTSAVGYESADDFNVAHINRAKVGYWTKCEMASLISHEMSHSKGFFHDGNSPANNQNSIPYQINAAYESAGCCK